MAVLAMGQHVLRPGGDRLSAYHALLYTPDIRLNLAMWYDWSHGACRDIERAFQKVPLGYTTGEIARLRCLASLGSGGMGQHPADQVYTTRDRSGSLLASHGFLVYVGPTLKTYGPVLAVIS